GDDAFTTEREGLKSNEEFSLVIDGVKTAETFVWTTMGDKVEVGAVTSKIEDNLLPNDFSLGQNYPNPFNPFTRISFTVPQSMKASVEVYNILGELVRTVFDGMAEAGRNEVIWDGTNAGGEPVASGIYFYRMKAGSFETSKKMVLMK
ncbi:MAG: FlgD immunoglobulin-like domain containing protein, partial [Candidatus Zixiibacteriota bacterium]